MLLAVLGVAYYCGGYVAGRMSRFDGARQGIGAWLIGLIITVVAGDRRAYRSAPSTTCVERREPAGAAGRRLETLRQAARSRLAWSWLGTLLAAALGGKAGERYHRKVDRAGFPADDRL